MKRARIRREGDRETPARERKALLQIFAMAQEMSGCTSYWVRDDDGTDLGLDPAIAEDLDVVRRFLGLPKEKKS